MKLSLTISGVLVLVISQVLGDQVSDEAIANFLQVAGLLVGTVVAWYGRFRHGDVTILGFKKD